MRLTALAAGVTAMGIGLSAAWADATSTALTTAPSATGQATGSPPTGTTSDADTMVCKKLDPPTGELIGERKVCMTKAEWEARRKADQDYLSRQQNGNGNCSPTFMTGGEC